MDAFPPQKFGLNLGQTVFRVKVSRPIDVLAPEKGQNFLSV
jgi:hypothetical protein